MLSVYRVTFDVKYSDSFGGYAVDIESPTWTQALEEAVSRWKRTSNRKMYNLSVSRLVDHPERFIHRSITRAYAPFWGISQYGDIAVTVSEKIYLEGHTEETGTVQTAHAGTNAIVSMGEEAEEARQYRVELITGILEYAPGKYSMDQLCSYDNGRLEKTFDRVSRKAFQKMFHCA